MTQPDRNTRCVRRIWTSASLAMARCARPTLLGIAAAWLIATAMPAAAQDLRAAPRTVAVGGYQRTYLLHVPAGVIRPSAVVMVFHGGGGRAEEIMRTTRMNDVADQQHFIVVYPEGGGGGLRGGTWNIGGPQSPSAVDDVDFVRAILADIGRTYPIDPRRIYATGESLGGVFAYRLACEMSETFAAIAPVAATMVEPNCAPRNPVAVLQIHGTADQNIPLNGGAGAMTAAGRIWPSPMRAVDFWARADNCASAPRAVPDGPETTCRIYDRCRAAVESCVLAGGGHAWPGSEPRWWQMRFHVYVSQSFPASRRIWDFFIAHPKA